MRTPKRFKAETKYTKSVEKKANVNLPVMARVGDGAGTAAVANKANFYWVRMYNDPNRVTQCYSMLPLANNDYIYMAKASDRKLTYYEFTAFIQLAGGGTGPPVAVHDHSSIPQGGNTIDLNGGVDNLILDGDGNTTISAPNNDQIDIEIGGADDFTFTANSFNVLSDSYITMADDTWIGIGAAAERIIFDAAGDISVMGATLGVGTQTPNANIESLSTTEQLRLSYDAASYTSFTVAGSSTMTVKPAETGGVIFQPTNDSVSFFQILDADGGTPIFNVDSTNEYVGIRTNVPGAPLSVVQPGAAGAVAVMTLYQGDIDMDFIRFNGTATAGQLDRSLVNYGDEAGSTAEVWIKVYVTDYGNQVTDQAYYLLGYTLS